ncbi:outer membrane beta-barrel protein [Roseisolibacter sp. H3M3-2]|uniref:outer membrane beta-barrel protein n=1 Tax=Roseisolibacter sp. H3M3-2 TaxID=3031323 RepID=UPI0023DA17B5|nr:outer membrane beta-barrel protein [Roseisolibacter sp. H3M3-2]MDF1502875.1 outer membrane beta-barrel protein [Roseisolibacter sp. H3M3-2]
MRRSALALAGLLIASPLAAQSRRPAGATSNHASIADVTPYAGVIMFGNYLDGPLGTSVRSRPAPIGGAQVSLGIAENLSLTGNVGYTSGDLEVGLPILGGVDVGSSSSWLYDAGLEYRIPAGTNLTPFVQAGAGAITTKLSGGPISTTSTNLAGNLGAGVDLAFGRSAALRIGVRDYIAKYRSESVLGVRASGDVAHNFAVSAGVKLSF